MIASKKKDLDDDGLITSAIILVTALSRLVGSTVPDQVRKDRLLFI